MSIQNNTSGLRDILAAVNALPEAGGAPVLQEKSNITPTKSQQTITPDSGYDGLSKVIVNKIPDEYVIPGGTKSITANGSGIDVANYAKVNVNVPTGVFPSGTKQITENGTHDVTDYASVNVNVAGSGGDTTEIDGMITGEITSISNSRITKIGKQAFRERGALISASFPNVTTMDVNAFYNCSVLANIDFPELQTIGNYSFYGCKKLVTVDFPKVTKIGTYAFNAATAMTALILRSSTVATLSGTNAFGGGHKVASGSGYIYVPRALVNSYKSASNWSTYSDQIRAIEDYPEITGG